MRYLGTLSTFVYLQKRYTMYHIKFLLQVSHVFMLQSIMGELINYFQ